ncbi:MAG: hypothetical protein H0W33_11125 [Gammaproteobacteria bacterium]|nr:hypothetical protein [Gammaproteobacteria bacterium]
MNLKLFLQILRARKKLVLFVLAATIAATALLTLNTPKEYATSTSLVIDFRDSGPFDQSGVPRQAAADYLMTQVDIIGSVNVAFKVLNLLDEEHVATLAREFAGNDTSRGVPLDDKQVRDKLAAKLLDNLTVDPSRESRVLSIRFSSPDPELSAAVADGFAQAYIEASLELNVAPARRNAVWFDEQLRTLRSRLEEKQNALTAYQQDKGIVAIDERLDTETRRFEELSSNLVGAQSSTLDVAARQLGQQHPEYKRAVEREQSIQRTLAQQKTRVFEVIQQRDELDLLVQDVENARKTYDLALQEYYQNSMESQFNQTNIAVLNQAAIPTRPSSPNLRFNLVLAAMLGLVFGFGLALAAEALARRVRTEEDLSDRIGVPVLITL